MKLPHDWSLGRLGDYVELVRGVTYPKAAASTVFGDDLIPILRATNISGELDFTGLIYVPDRFVRAEQMIRVGDVVVATSSGSRSVVGKAAAVRQAWEGSFGAFCMVVRPGDGLVPAYLAHYMQSRAYRHEVSRLAAGIGIHNLRRSHLEELRIPVPPLTEQARIAAALDEQFSRLDVAKRAMRAASQKSATLLARLWQQASSSEAQAASHWRRARLTDITVNLDSKRVPVNARDRAKRLGAVPYYGATGQVGWIDRALFDEELVLLGEDGAPFLNRNAPKAYRIEGPSWVNNHAHVLRPMEGVVSARYLVLALNSVAYSGYVNGTTRLKLTKGAMNRIEIDLPPLTEQHALVADFDAKSSSLDAVTASVDHNSRRAVAMHDSLLREGLAGRLFPVTLDG